MTQEYQSFDTNILSKEVVSFLSVNCNLNSTNVKFFEYVNKINKNVAVDTLINNHKINNIRYLNKFFESVNSKLDLNGKYILCVEIFYDKRESHFLFKIPYFKQIYFLIQFIFLRLIPKIRFFKNIFFLITKGRNRFLSKSETLGRLISCGFDIDNFKKIGDLLYIVALKKSEPKFDMKPSYGPVYKMPRVGKNNKIIKVYKLRTMHPYSEYLQNFMFDKYGTKNGDKVNNDFRVTALGAFFRKFWLDELPMIINLFKGDIKIVGVRPLSIAKFNMYPKYAQKLRVMNRPGLFPPFYVDFPNNFKELVDSEIKYLLAYEKSPIKTDVKYFFLILRNIFFRHARSK